MRAAVRVGISEMCLGLVLCGCAAERPSLYERRIQICELALDVGPVDNAYRMLVREKTQGRFSSSLAIAKLVPGPQNGPLELAEMTHAEEAYWVEAVRGVSAVSDLQFLSPISVRPDGPRTDTLCAAASERGARLLLLYASNRYGPNSAQVLGVLYDTKAGQPIAALHASACHLNEEGEEVALDNERGDQREVDANYQASRACEQHLVTCLGELIQNDSPPPTTQPHHWDTPPAERWWLRHARHDR